MFFVACNASVVDLGNRDLNKFEYDRSHAIKANVFYPYHIKASVLFFMLHCLWPIFLADFMDCSSDLPIWLLLMC